MILVARADDKINIEETSVIFLSNDEWEVVLDAVSGLQCCLPESQEQRARIISAGEKLGLDMRLVERDSRLFGADEV